MEYVKAGGAEIPKIGLGTARLEGKECVAAVRSALELGYRHVDTAQMYGNEDQVGEAISKSSVERKEVFLVTKLDRGNLDFQGVIQSTNRSLERLGTDYIDLLLIHSPSRRTPLSETLEAMNQLQQQGKVEHIGVSNFSGSQMEEAIEESEEPVVTNQVEFNPYCTREKLYNRCLEEEVALTAYSPLSQGDLVKEEVLEEIAERYSRSPAQVALRWLVQKENTVAIPKASRKAHLQQNIEVFDFKLSESEMEMIDRISPGFLQRLKSRLGI